MQSLGRATGSGNQTVDWLRRIGRGDIAEKVASGSLPAGQALTLVSGTNPQATQAPQNAPVAPQAAQSGMDNTSSAVPPDMMQQFQNMTPGDRARFLERLNQGYSPEEAAAPDGYDGREMLMPMSGAVTGGPERVYQAQATAGDQPQIPGYNFDDNVTDRRLAGQELDYRTALGRLESIDQQLAENPELLEGMTFSGNLRRQGLAFWERLGFDLSDDSEEYLSDQTAFRQSILRNINRTIQEVTGAQMGEQEARRIRAEMPDVTASPTEFRTQLSNAMNMIRMDAARVQVWRMGGSEGEASSVTDADVMQALRERGASAYQEALQQGLSTSEARLQAARMLREEFGL